MSFKTYENYKNSGIEWIGEIPEHWDIKPLKYIAKTIPGGTPSTNKLEYWENGDIPWLPSGMVQNCVINEDDVFKFITLEGLMNSATKYIGPNSVLIALTGATCANIALLTFKATANQSVISIEPYKFLPEFLYYFLQSQREQILINKTGGAQSGINEENVKNISVVSLTVFEQEKIVNYLDKKTSEIDKKVAKNKKLISLLEEKKVALINQTVTKGLDLNVPMKDSKIDIVGQVPNQNKIIRLKFLCDISTGDKDTVDRNPEGLYPFYVRSPIIERIDTYSFDGEAILMAGDGVGAGKVFHYVNGKFDFHQRVYNLHNFKNIFPKFLYYYMSNIFSIEIEKGSAKSTVDSIRLPMLNDFLICFPDLNEQKKIVNYLDNEISKLDKILDKVNKQIKLLEEYKGSLIHHVVTGKIDVRDEV